MSDSPMCVCKACGFGLPQDLMSNPARCYDCESARTRKAGKAPRPGSKAAETAAAKASGLYVRHDLGEFRAAKRAAYVERNRERSRLRSRASYEAGATRRLAVNLQRMRQQAAHEKTVFGVVLDATRRKLELLGATVEPS